MTHLRHCLLYYAATQHVPLSVPMKPLSDPMNLSADVEKEKASTRETLDLLERIPVMWKRSLHVGSNWRILAY